MKKNILIATTVLIIIIIISILMYYNEDHPEENEIYVNNYLSEKGYVYNEKEKVYEKITSNNTLNDYYNDLASNKSTNFNQYYFNYTNNNFIELYMQYQNNITELFNINSTLPTNVINYNYEITKDDSSIILEGTYNNERVTCNIVSLKKMTDNNKNRYCENAKTYINRFIEEEKELLKDKEFNKIINLPKKEVIIKK